MDSDVRDWYAVVLARGVPPGQLERRRLLQEAVHDRGAEMADAMDDLANFLGLLLEGNTEVALSVGRPDTERAWRGFTEAVARL
jgi:hypothetical protein